MSYDDCVVWTDDSQDRHFCPSITVMKDTLCISVFIGQCSVAIKETYVPIAKMHHIYSKI